MDITYLLRPAAAPTAVALGCFDGIHPGHRAVLNAALAGAKDGLLPAVFTFGTPERMLPPAKNACELMSARMKRHIFEEMGFASLTVAEFEAVRTLSPKEFVQRVLCDMLRARLVCCGFNYRFGLGGSGDAALLQKLGDARGVRVCVVPPVEADGAPISSSRIRTAVEAGDMAQAARLLGQPFTIDFPVVHGRQLGRTIGIPTINQEFPASFVLPRFGVYATSVTVNGTEYRGVTNAGVKPTVGADRPLAETFISGYAGDLYGQCIEVRFLRFLRPERRFDSVESLRRQILADAEAGCAG